ncbi:MAG TPA: TonB-dependent receptor [Nevskiaceae bacterium]|nr:TonB-dependent receptor [Nevskiaceae bacterium]
MAPRTATPPDGAPAGSDAEAGATMEPASAEQRAQADATAPLETAAAPATTETVPVIPVAQKDTPDVSATAPHGDTAQLDEIVVTATKRNQSLRKIPSTINVITGEKLETQGARELQDFVDQIPGLQMQDASVTSSRKIVIRGIAPDDVGNQTVGTLLGDVPMSDAIGSYTVVDPDTWDLETVEVLKGPQGTLFGASSLAGIIRYVPKAPQLGLWQGKAEAEYMSTKDGGAAPAFSAALNVPVGNEFAMRFSGTREKRPGVIDINTPGRQQKDADAARKWSGRAMLFWQPTERATINAWYMAQQRNADEQFFVTNYNADYTRYDAPSKSPTDRKFAMGVIDARYRFDWATVVSLSALQKKHNNFNIDASYVLLEPAADAGVEVGRTLRKAKANGFMQELRLVSPDDGPWLWQAGAFYSDFRADVYSDIFLTDPLSIQAALQLIPEAQRSAVASDNGVSLGSAHLYPLGATEGALFGELTRELGPVNLTLGGRYYKTKTIGTSTVAGIAPFAATGSPVTVEDLQVADKGFSPKGAVTWQATGDILVYGTISRGFQYGGVNNRAVPTPGSNSPRTYKSSALWNYEAGVRTDWLERTLRADFTAFYLDWTNAQISQQIPPADFYIDNVGKVKVKGMEASLRYYFPLDGLSLETTGGYLDSRTAGPFTDGSGNVVAPGAEMPNAPKIQYTATLNYLRTFSDVWSTATALQFNHVGQAFGNIEHTGLLDARNMLNFNFSVSRPDLAFAPALGLIVNNITDQRKIVSSTQSPQGAAADLESAYGVGYTRPRTFILRLSGSFQ